jgi:DNA-binding HxlR family transcriptional regulator
MDDSYAQQADGTWRHQDHQSPPASQPLARGRPKPANQQSPVPSLPTLSLSQLLTRPLPQQLWLVEPLLSRGGVMGLAGDPGTAKTWLILELARSVATGRPFLDKFPTQQGPVLIIDEENGEARLHRRLARIMGQTIDDCPIHIASMCGVNLSHDRWIDSLNGKVVEIKPILILFDSLIRVHRGGENSAEDMAMLFAVFTSFRHDFDCAVVFTHHLRKTGFIRDLGQRIRGSSDILAYVDSMLGLTKLETAYTLWHLKNRDGDLIKPLSLSVQDTDENTTLIRATGEVDEENSKKEQARDLIMYALADGDKFREELTAFVREAGISDRTFASALKELEIAKLIVGTLEGRKKKYSTFGSLQTMQPIYNTMHGLQRSHPGNRELTSEEKELLVKHWTDRGKPTVTLGRSQWFNLEAILYSTDMYLAQKRRDHTPALRQILVRWSNNHMEVPNESIEVRSGE